MSHLSFTFYYLVLRDNSTMAHGNPYFSVFSGEKLKKPLTGLTQDTLGKS